MNACIVGQTLPETLSSPLKNWSPSSPPRKRGSRSMRKIWIPAFAGMTVQGVCLGADEGSATVR